MDWPCGTVCGHAGRAGASLAADRGKSPDPESEPIKAALLFYAVTAGLREAIGYLAGAGG